MIETHLTNLKSAWDGFVHDSRDEPPEDPNSEPKIWLMARRDRPMTIQKFGAQAGHAYGMCMVLGSKSNGDMFERYLATGSAKIVVKVKNENELHAMVALCREAMLPTTIVQDAGRTEFDGKTYTVAAVGPCLRSDLPKKVANLRLFEGYDVQEA